MSILSQISGRLWLRRKPATATPGVLPAYRHDNALRRHRKMLGLALFLFTIIYIMAFQLIGRFIVAQFVLPLVILFLLVIWALPERGRPKFWPLKLLFFGFAGALLLWPDYLALSLPGMPWITALRLTGGPMILVLLISLSISKDFRADIHEIMRDLRPFPQIILALLAIITLSLVYSVSLASSLNHVQLFYVNAIGAMIVACLVFSTPGRAMGFVYFWWAAGIIICLIALWEARLGHVPWVGRIPSFLMVEDEAVQRILSPNARKATGILRVQSKFKNPLNLAEFLALTSPFLIHFMMSHRVLFVRLLAAATLPLFFWIIVKTDSRLGMGGFMISFIFYVLWWGTLRWRRDRQSIFGPAVVMAFPALFAMFIAATFAIRRLEIMVWGSGAQAASDMSRQMQWVAGIPKILERPWGHGWGAGGAALGFRNQIGTLTIDSFYLTLLMDIGIVGFALFIGLFVLMPIKALIAVPKARTVEQELLLPIGISCLVFLITKSVLSEQENNPLMFILLGLGFALMRSIAREGTTARISSQVPAKL